MPSYLITLPVALLSLFTLSLSSPKSAPRVAIPRIGKVILHHTVDESSFGLGAIVGCLDVNGRLIADTTHCATYTVSSNDANLSLAKTNAGECGFHFTDEPKNPDQAGNPDWSAFRCKAEGSGSHDFVDQFDLLPQSEMTYVATVAGSGVNWKVFTKSLPGQNGNDDAVDVFTRAYDLGEGSVDMFWVWQDS